MGASKYVISRIINNKLWGGGCEFTFTKDYARNRRWDPRVVQ